MPRINKFFNAYRFALLIGMIVSSIAVSAQMTGQLIDPAGGIYFEDRIIVQFQDGVSAADTAAFDAFILSMYGGIKIATCYCDPPISLYQFPGGVDIETVRQVAREEVGVESTGRDYLINEQLNNVAECIADANYNELINAEAQRKVRVGILDSGIDPMNPALQNYLEVNPGETPCYLDDDYGYDFVNTVPNLVDNIDHGSPVNGVISTNQSSEAIELINAKFYDFQGELFHVLCGLNYLIDRDVDIINMSLGYKASQISTALFRALLKAQQKNILVVTSAGNDGERIDFRKWPASFTPFLRNMLTVTGFETCGAFPKLPVYANRGFFVQLAAPSYVIAPDKDGNDMEFTGTSFSSAYVTRLAATLLAENPQKTPIEARNCILSNAEFRLGLPYRVPNVQRTLACKPKKPKHGYGSYHLSAADDERSELPYRLDRQQITIKANKSAFGYILSDITGRVIFQSDRPMVGDRVLQLPKQHQIYLLTLLREDGPETFKFVSSQ